MTDTAALREALTKIRTLCDRDRDDLARSFGSTERVYMAIIPAIVDEALAAAEPDARDEPHSCANHDETLDEAYRKGFNDGKVAERYDRP